MKNCRPRLSACLLLVAAMSLIGCFAWSAEPPPSPRTPVIDDYHGVKVVDDYRWLENANDPAVKAWSEAQSRYSRAWLDALPDRAGIEAKLTEWYTKDTPGYGYEISRPGLLFALKFQPPKQQPMIVTLASANDLASEKVVLDPNALEPKGLVAIDWYVPSPDGSLVAVCLSKNGTEDGTLHFYRTHTGEALPDSIPRVQYPTAGGSAAWTPDGKAIYYTRYPHAGETPEADLNFFQRIYIHKLGAPETEDVFSVGNDFPRIAEIDLTTSRDNRWLLASVANGDGGQFAHFIRDFNAGDSASWREITHFEDAVKQVAFSCDDSSLYLRSVKDAPRGKVLRMPLNAASGLKEAAVVVPESDAVVEGIAPTASFLFVAELVGGPSRIRRFDLDGNHGIELPIPPTSGVEDLLALEDRPDDNRVLFNETSYIEPRALYLYEPPAGNEEKSAGVLKKTALVKKAPVDFTDIEVVREFATSRDGTKVPLNILRRKGRKLDGSNPTLLYAYGGYGISERPEFDFPQRLWFDRGGVYVVANIRGGGEYGEQWHLAGNLTKKQNVFDDFAACAEYLIHRGYTNPTKLATEGGSNGGLLMGAFLTQHPELVRAVVSHVGIYDMLRVELDPNGAFNVTEFGSVKDPEQFKALYAYSPYHHVVDGVKYPAVFFLAGENDGRVNPANSRKMTARLQAATSSGLPILLRLSSGSGHGMGTALTERIAQRAAVFAFLFDQLGMKPIAHTDDPKNTEPTNAREAADKKAAEDKAIDEKFLQWKTTLSSEQQQWESTLEANLGSFYLPLYKREKVRGSVSAWDYVKDDPKLPRVLLIGDSVSRGYTLATREALAGKANVHRAPENCGPAANGLKKLDIWLGDLSPDQPPPHWDAIHFNFGIHDRATKPTDYEDRLEQIIARLQKTGARLIWASTTPVPPDTKDGPEATAAIVEKNEIAARVMQKHSIAIDALFTFITPHVPQVQNPKDVHFNGEGYKLLGSQVAAFVETALDTMHERHRIISLPDVAPFDLQAFIDTAIKAGSKRVVIPPGRYRVTPKNGSHLAFKDLANVEIIATGVEMVCTETVMAVHFENCHDVHFTGLTVDYDPLPYTEARITALAPDKSWVEFQVIDGYPDSSLEERIEIYDPATRELRRDDADWSKQIDSLGDHFYRATKHPGYHFDERRDTEQIGDILVTNNAFPARAGGHAVVLTRCAGMKLEDVTVYASPCFGFIEGQCDATTYLQCKIDRRAPEDDPIQRGFPRMRSLDADAFHSSEAVKGPAILDCTAKFQGDDCVNIHGVYHFVTASTDRTLRAAALGRMTIEPGDPVEFLPFSGTRPPDAIAEKIEPDSGITDEEKAFIQKLSLNSDNKRLLLEGKATFYKITLNRDVPLPMGSAVCSGRRVGNGFAVKGCDFGYNRSRGILIKASHGEITGNRITHGWMAAVLIAPEFWWFEAASSSDLTVKDNVITDCRRPAIEIIAPGGNGRPLASGAHRDLRILNNTITDSVWPNIRATSTAGLVLSGNRLTLGDPGVFVPPQPFRWDWGAAKPSAVSTELCEIGPGSAKDD
jgi:prolyl oligopeptidase